MMSAAAYGRRAALLPALAIALVPAGFSADAAMRLCRAFVTGDLASAPTEKAAKKQALESWTAKAKALDDNASWHVAAQKALTCTQADDKSFQCLARGNPCTITQAPPKNLPPLKPPGSGA